MPDQPKASQLLQSARKLLLEELLPQLPQEHHYAALMIANAMAIAAREADAGDSELLSELELLAQLYDEQVRVERDGDVSAQLAELNARLVQDIRAGHFSGESERQLRQLLMRAVLARLNISNPKYLPPSTDQ